MKQLILRTCHKDGTSYNGFKWPLEVGAKVTAPDWNQEPECGGGLHGLLWGEGNGALLDWSEGATAIVFSFVGKHLVDIGGKYKCKMARVEHVGTIAECAKYIYDNGGAGRAICGLIASAGYRGTATAGDRGTASAGYRGSATAGDDGTATAGDRGTATAGYGGTASAGDDGTATAGDRGTATAGYGGTASAGYGGTASAGDYGTATAGDCGTASAGYRGTASAGDYGTATAGYGGIINLYYYDGTRFRIETGYIGEGGLKPGVPYRLNAKHGFEEVVA